jgi:hypothetical protein
LRLLESFCQLRGFDQLLLPSVSGRVFTTHANYMAPRIADKVFFESRSRSRTDF